jgi:hypothetical protein
VTRKASSSRSWWGTKFISSRSEFSDYLGWKNFGEIAQVLWNDGGQGRNRTADASLFRAANKCIFNDLKELGGLRKFLKGRERRTYVGWESWVETGPPVHFLENAEEWLDPAGQVQSRA